MNAHSLAEQARLDQRWDLSFIDPARIEARAHAVALRTVTVEERYHLDPVLRRARMHGIDHISELAVWLGVSRESVYRWRSGFSWQVADRIACHLNVHPSALWPDWSLDADHLLEDVAS